jgi:putative nucleotidyltransferase with HDIG domain
MASKVDQIQKRIRNSIQVLPVLPVVVMKVIDLVDQDEVSAEQLQRTISMEPALSSKVLQLANSAYYGLSRQVSTIQQAVIVLGFQAIKNLVLGISAFQMLRGTKPTTSADLALWEHSFACAGVASEIAKLKRMSLRQVETIFMGGLLHDIGLLYLRQQANSDLQRLERSALETVTRHEAELQELGIDHAEIGGLIADHWQLPTPLVRMIRDHHALYISLDEYSDMVACVMLADEWLHSVDPDQDAGFASPHASEDAIAWAKLSDEQRETILHDVLERVEAIRQAMAA